MTPRVNSSDYGWRTTAKENPELIIYYASKPGAMKSYVNASTQKRESSSQTKRLSCGVKKLLNMVEMPLECVFVRFRMKLQLYTEGSYASHKRFVLFYHRSYRLRSL